MTGPAYNASPVQRSSGGGLAEVVELILDKGLVIDAYVRISLVGIELITIDARIVVASVDTYLRFAEATNRLDLSQRGSSSILGAKPADDLPENHRRRPVERGAPREIVAPEYDYEDEYYEERPRRRRERPARRARGEREP
jgi:hypothetical protein